jgi:hypothetical protein
VQILDRYNIELDREKFLTVCGKCGGNIITCEGEIYREIVRKKKSIIENRKLGIKETSEEVEGNSRDDSLTSVPVPVGATEAQEETEEKEEGDLKKNQNQSESQQSESDMEQEMEMGNEDESQTNLNRNQMRICGAVCQVKKGCEATDGVDEEGIHWVPRDREIFMCESCCQVIFPFPAMNF